MAKHEERMTQDRALLEDRENKWDEAVSREKQIGQKLIEKELEDARLKFRRAEAARVLKIVKRNWFLRSLVGIGWREDKPKEEKKPGSGAKTA